MIYSYARVSTAGQDLHEQVGELITAGVDKKNIFSEKFTGTTTNRPKFNELMEHVSPGDMIVERTQAGKEYTKLHNPKYKDGRPKKYKLEQLDLAIDLLETNSYTRVAKMIGISKSTLRRENNRRLK